MLEVRNLHCAYGNVRVLHGVSFDVVAGEIHCLMGRNGAGKTTTLRAIMGLMTLANGTIKIGGKPIDQMATHDVPKLGIGYIPQGRRLFSELSVSENLEIGLMARNSNRQIREQVLEIFPRLRERLDQRAETLSGGEQQMLATARALCLEPKILLLDEPTEGLQPSMIEQIQQVIFRLKEQGVAIVLVEQRKDAVLALADRVTFIENGVSKEVLKIEDLARNDQIFARYVGV